MSDFLVGDKVEVIGYVSTVRYVGEPEFARGEWIGVELPVPMGKNNGTVEGVQYFSCPEKFGMFVRASVPRFIERPMRPPPRPQQKRMSVTSPPSMATKARSMTLRSPAKPASPTKGLTSAPSSAGPSTPRTSTPTVGNKAAVKPTLGRPGSMAPPPKPGVSAAGKRASISSTSGAAASSSVNRAGSVSSSRAGTPSAGANRLSLKGSTLTSVSRKPSTQSGASDTLAMTSESPTATRKALSTTSSTATRVSSTSTARMSTTARRESLAPPTALRTSSSRTSLGRTSTPSSAAELAAAQREVEDLKSKIKILEKKRIEDREKLKTLDRVQEEHEKCATIIRTLQAKYRPQHQELTELRKRVGEMETTMVEMEEQKAEHELVVEMATLDREMAEQEAESYKADLDAVRGKAEELEMEMELLREENEELSKGMSSEERTSAGWLQMEKQNERLREALVRLRELTMQTEEELKESIKDLEEENTELQKYKNEYEATRERLIAADSAVEDLRQQLETALGAEELLEELTERNMTMGEQLDELRATIEDLESLKEISDELEINHIESEKQMQEELDYRDSVIVEQHKLIQQLETNNEEAEYTVTRFREVVNTLQSDLEDMRASQQITESEAQELTERSRSMMDINMKLQITAAKAQNKTIDLELRRLQADEARHHLEIVQLFLPDSFDQDKSSVAALLGFKRVAFKANLLQNFVKERLTAQTGHDDSVMAATDVCDKLTWVAAMCNRFTSCISSCSVAEFERFKNAKFELEPVERALSGWIEGLRKDELKEQQCAAELQRSIALMSHLGEVHLRKDLEGFAGDTHMRALLMQSYMESSATAISHIRHMALSKLAPSPTPENHEEEEVAANFAKKADAVISHARSAKVIVGKVLRALDEFRQRSLSLTQDHLPEFEACEESSKKLVDYTRALGNAIHSFLYEDPAAGDNEDAAGTRPTLTWQQLESLMNRTTEKVLVSSESDIFGALTKELRNLSNNLVELASTASDVDMTVEFDRAQPPWLVRAQDLKAIKVVSVDVEEQLRRLKEDLVEKATTIKLRQKELDESAVKIELLESRMQNVAKQATRIEDLEHQLAASSEREKSFENAIENLNEEMQTIEAELAKARKANDEKIRAAQPLANSVLSAAAQERAVATAREVAALKRDIVALKNAVAHYRHQNDALRTSPSPATPEAEWLFTPLLTTPSKSREQKIENELVREGRDVFAELRRMVLEEKVVDLKRQPDVGPGRMQWRPQRESTRWWVEKQRERHEVIRSWQREVAEKAREHRKEAEEIGVRRAKRGGKEGERGAAATALLKIVAGKDLTNTGEVVIREPEGWEQVARVVGIEA